MEISKASNLEHVCRTCLKMNKFRVNLFQHLQNDRLVAEMLMECLSIRVHKDDGLPDNICSNCLERLTSAYDFKKMAIQSDMKLHVLYERRELVNNIHSFYIKKETTIMDCKQTNAIFDLSENINLEEPTLDTLTENLSVNNNLDNNTTIIFPKSESKLQDNVYTPNNMQSSGHNIIQSVLTSRNNSNTPFAFLNSSGENKYINQSKFVCSENLKEASSTYELVNGPSPLPTCTFEKTEGRTKRNKRRNRSDVLNNSDTTFKCDKCQKIFAREYFLKQHMRIHLETKKFSCDICERTFRTLHGAQIHKTTHSDERPYKCTVCDKTFKYNDILKHHLLIHKNDKKFVCELCGKTFINSAGLIHHKSTHNTERSFACTICGKCFKSQPRLSDHLRRHSDAKPYVCHYCDSRFKCSNVLKSHILIHTGAKPFSCAICDKKFRQRPSLRYHMRIHTGETPYECELCSSKFKYKQHLSNHMKVHKNKSSQNQDK